jgi:S-adenosyl methyltransferase
VSDYLRALPSGSYLVISRPASHVDSSDAEQAAQRYNERVASRMRRRSRSEMARFFDGLEFAEPGIRQLVHWRPAVTGLAAPSSGYAGVGGKR